MIASHTLMKFTSMDLTLITLATFILIIQKQAVIVDSIVATSTNFSRKITKIYL